MQTMPIGFARKSPARKNAQFLCGTLETNLHRTLGDKCSEAQYLETPAIVKQFKHFANDVVRKQAMLAMAMLEYFSLADLLRNRATMFLGPMNYVNLRKTGSPWPQGIHTLLTGFAWQKLTPKAPYTTMPKQIKLVVAIARVDCISIHLMYEVVEQNCFLVAGFLKENHLCPNRKICLMLI